jgi:chaperone modulatory protein CbpM
MKLHPLDSLSPDRVGFSDLSAACAISEDELQELMEYGALAPMAPLASSEPEPMFAITCLQPLRTAGKLRRDYDLDLFVVVIVMDYLRRIENLESQLQSLQAQSGLAH